MGVCCLFVVRICCLGQNWLVFVVSYPQPNLTTLGFFVLYGIHGLREWLTKKGENKNRGYQQLPQ